MSSLVSCMGSDGNSVAFISRNNQSDSYYLHYWSTNGTLIYSNTLSSIKGCPDFANFTGSCSYDRTQTSMIVLFKSLNSTNLRPSSVISQLQIGDSPSFINVRAFKDTKIVSAVNLATHSKNVIAFISEKLHGFAELSLNLLYSNGTISKWASLKQTGILLPSIETNGLYVLQNKTISEYQTNSSVYHLFSNFSSVLPLTGINTMASKKDQSESIYFYDQSNRQLIIYTRTVSPSQLTTPYLTAETSPTYTEYVTRSKQSIASAIATPTKTKQDLSEWETDIRSVENTNCTDNSCVMALVAVADSRDGEGQSWFTITNSGQDGFSISRAFQDDLITPDTKNHPTEVLSAHLSEGSIAGIVVGGLLLLALVFSLFWFIKRQRSKIVSYRSRDYTFKESVPFQSVAIRRFHLQTTPFGIRPGGLGLSSTHCRATEDRPDIRPLSYVEGRIDYAHLSDEEMLVLEPEEREFMSLFNGIYTSPAEQRVYRTETHTTRMFFTEEGECSVHYFTACHLETFIRAVHAVSLQSSDYVMKSHRAIVLASPTPKFNYQCLWITSRTLPSNTLHTFLLHKKPSEKQKARWIWCFLKAVQSVHQHGLVHLSIDTHSFYQTASGDWILGNFVTVQKQGSLLSCNYSSGFMPPEYLKEGPHLATAEADLWSLGGVIYTLVTQDLVTLADEMVLDNVKDPYSRTLLDDILQVSPNCRKSIQSALDSWNSIYHFEST